METAVLPSDVAASLSYLEQQYEKFSARAPELGADWTALFSALTPLPTAQQPAQQLVEDNALRLFRLIDGYRSYGHLKADINPVAVTAPELPWQLSLDALGLRREELSTLFPTFGLLADGYAPLSTIIDTLETIYCGKIGFEYRGVEDPELERWIQHYLEYGHRQRTISTEQRQMIFQQLNESRLLDHFLHMKYPGQKRFSLEGGETLIPMLSMLIAGGGTTGVREVILGMAHRGRLNVLANILKKPYSDLFSEFEDYTPYIHEHRGDVKYHRGFCSPVTLPSGDIVKVMLAHNPSHLEAIDPVVEGIARAKQWRLGSKEILPLLIHGDAALAGQGVVYETLQLSRLRGYSTGGTIHIVVNNQIGFTTIPSDGRSTHYCSAIAATFGIPVFHVNAEDPEACIFVANMAVELRQRFHCDLFIDLNCYRKYGHNEGDEPAFTQPLEYQLIRRKKHIRDLYHDQLIASSLLDKNIVEAMEAEFNKALQQAHDAVKKQQESEDPHNQQLADVAEEEEPTTALSADVIKNLGERLCQVPSTFKLHRKIEQLLADRRAMVSGEEGASKLDWGMGELLAYGSLLTEGYSLRLAGQDVQRGTFSHRHAVLVDQENEAITYSPLQHLATDQGTCEIVNSPLSEYAALGFEYGYSVAATDTMVIWEAQFGDFANGAQVVIDQFIATGEQKWGQCGPLVLFLPHGYEGQGPEHSSARIERFLSLSSGDNWRIVYPTLPAQLFHLLRGHRKGRCDRPLVVFTPKGLLRHPSCVSSLSDLVSGGFQTILDDPAPPSTVRRLALTTGRIYYDLDSERRDHGINDLSLVRVEQLYPFDEERVKEILAKYSSLEICYWIQEEPRNMGAWQFMAPRISSLLPSGLPLRYVGRDSSASPATGSYVVHQRQHQAILASLLKDTKDIKDAIISP